jgi:hypothetical protein
MIAKLEKHDWGLTLYPCEWIHGSPAKRGISEIIQDWGGTNGCRYPKLRNSRSGVPMMGTHVIAYS